MLPYLFSLLVQFLFKIQVLTTTLEITFLFYLSHNRLALLNLCGSQSYVDAAASVIGGLFS